MFGRLIGKVLALPVRLANVPLQAASKASDALCGQRNTAPVKDRDPIGLGEVADAIEQACDDE